ncbi:MAG: hypothetical protein G8D61_18815 [gamma proteobacterium symbiont of Ctena orbiculata]|nr:putative Ig domain-containing protein [Candidatus Thiodiazotropha taylori]MBT3057289.1 putative Ig domain-containing protein [Candidatus Thiodiazotropha sp. (ex Lucina pensylvanica)]MBV2094068.1 putative Ig domain-containing protein [Candidatus Thiodiazotropha sp. (ex Codakia orbicularis)]PUB73420.1 MAG: hypothetical protein DBP03_12675 [gamma proteobacterium symbiont of Ctena orbiculata]MBT3061169.1 putative Ig domain-containing protein [Candidatus Thiodiazotropha sp. (ex Lucina pensylvanic
MRSLQAVFTTITLGIILSACGGGGSVSESDQLGDAQGTAVSNGSESTTPTTNDTTTDSGQATTTPAPSTPTSGSQTIVRADTGIRGAANLAAVTVSGSDVLLGWFQPNDIPSGGYDIIIDGVNTKAEHRTVNTTLTIGGLDLSVQHCFVVRARYTQALPTELYDSNSQCTDGPQGENQAPVISGNPADSVAVGDTYAFTPSATDNDNDELTFSIANLPAWADFDTQTGTLSGTPAAGDEGDYNNITISVSDGAGEANLAAFSIAVTADAATAATGSMSLRWVAPTTRTDGSPLNLADIKGYCIYIGTTRNNLEMVVDLTEGDRTDYILDNLELGDYYVAVSVYDQQDVMSSYSNVVMKSVVN